MTAVSIVAIILQIGQPTGKIVTPLHFGANVEFFRPGLAAGVTYQQRAFAEALRASGVRALRFPGGNAAYYYLPESRDLTMKLAHATGHWEFRENSASNNHFVTLEQLAAFCRDANVKLIYQLPCLFYLDGQTPRAIIRSKLADKAKNYDHDRIDEGVAYGVQIIRRLRKLKAPVAAWELGNEEFALCSVKDYARVVAAYTKRIRQVDPDTPIIAVGMKWMTPLVEQLKREGMIRKIHSFQVHYPFGNWPQPGSPDQRSDAALFAMGNLKMKRFLDAVQAAKRKLGIAQMPTSITETTTMRFQAWDVHAIIGTHAHALCYAWNWMTLLERPEVDMAVFHDLETPFFGMLRYDAGFDARTRRFVWLSAAQDPAVFARRFPREYVLSPTGCANCLLAGLIGEELVTTNIKTTRKLRALASRNRVLLVNRSGKVIRIDVPFARASAKALTADSLDSCLPGTFGIRALAVRASDGRCVVDVPPWSVCAVCKGR